MIKKIFCYFKDGDSDLELISGCSVYGLRVRLYVEEILKAGQSY
jgi:hypothetical protein